MNCTSISAPTAHAFDPCAWLTRFETVGGAYILTDRLSLAILVEDRPDDDLVAARLMIAGLADADRAAIVEHLRRRRDEREG